MIFRKLYRRGALNVHPLISTFNIIFNNYHCNYYDTKKIIIIFMTKNLISLAFSLPRLLTETANIHISFNTNR